MDDYRRKRDRRRTPEPFGGAAAGDAPIFVIQRHDARRLHYDLRLEIGGARLQHVPVGGFCSAATSAADSVSRLCTIHT